VAVLATKPTNSKRQDNNSATGAIRVGRGMATPGWKINFSYSTTI
jgi:hypothetical protein